ncbi:MAG TPA: lysophospholipid acyltransferase family protein [Solirubrobacteraceae bacterium]|nr:lysophospholipid acyltransferase family protein [Solirubrobacteraceae bacterium]
MAARKPDIAGEDSRTGGLSPVERQSEDPAGASAAIASQLEAFREHCLTSGVNPVLYWLVRAVLLPSFLLYFRLKRIGGERIPSEGPVLFAANHRSFLDPFVIGALTRRPVYYMAKRELFERRWQAWLLNSLGAFPVDRGTGDEHAMATARMILERGDCVVIFPEGTRVRPGPLGRPHRGVGRLALQTGALVVPVAVMGTEDVRRGWRIRPRKVTLHCGRPLRFPVAERPSPSIALGVAERIWACVSLQWEWLGGASAAAHSEGSPPGSAQRQARAA